MVKYAIELSTCGESGTYMAFQEIWQGMPKQLFRLDQEGEIVPPDPETPLHYTLEVDPGLFGRIRLRCWNGGERRPSAFSEEIKLERFQGKVSRAVLFEQLWRAALFEQLWTSAFGGELWRVGSCAEAAVLERTLAFDFHHWTVIYVTYALTRCISTIRSLRMRRPSNGRLSRPNVANTWGHRTRCHPTCGRATLLSTRRCGASPRSRYGGTAANHSPLSGAPSCHGFGLPLQRLNTTPRMAVSRERGGDNIME